MNATKQRPRHRTRRGPRPLTADEAERARSRAGRVALYALFGLVVMLVALAVDWRALVESIRDAIRAGARDAAREEIEDRKKKEREVEFVPPQLDAGPWSELHPPR